MSVPACLYPFVPPGANIIRPSMTEQGYMYVASQEAIKDTTPMDTALWQRLPFGKAQPQGEQSLMVDAFQVPSSRGTSIAMGAPLGDPASVVTNQVNGATPASQSKTNNRGKVKNQLDKRRDTYFISEEAELWSGQGAVAGGITSEKMREIQRKTQYQWTQVEYDLYTNVAQVEDLQDGSTAGKAAGIPNLLGITPTNWANLGWTANVNVVANSAGAKTATTFASLKEVTEANVKQMLMFCNKSGCGKSMHLFCPDIYHNEMSDKWEGRPNVAVNVNQSDKGLDMGFETYGAVSGIQLTVIPDRTAPDTCMLLLDLQGWEKRMGLPFGMYKITDGLPDHRGYLQFSWTVLGDPRRGAAWYVGNGPQ